MLRFKKNQKYLVFDTETESLNLHFSRPWQLAGILYDGQKEIDSFDYLIRWDDLQISRDAARITQFDNYKYKAESIDPKIVWSKVKKYFEDEEILLVGHNIINFDIYQINNLLRNIEVENDWSFVKRCIDTNCLAKAIEINEPVNQESIISWMFKMSFFHKRTVKTSLGFLAKKYDIEVEEGRLHDALYDVGINAKVFFKQIFEIEI